jgi:hypothetical protein
MVELIVAVPAAANNSDNSSNNNTGVVSASVLPFICSLVAWVSERVLAVSYSVTINRAAWLTVLTESAPNGTPSNARRSRLPVLGGTHQNAFLDQNVGPPYQNSPMTRQPLGGGVGRNLGNFALGGGGGGKVSRRSGGTPINGPLGR